MAWRDLVQHNFWWKLTAVILATLIWLTVDKGERGRNADKSGEAARRFEHVPIQLLTEPGIAGTYSTVPKTVSFVAKGPSGVLELLSPEDFTVYTRVLAKSDKTNGHFPVHVSRGDSTEGAALQRFSFSRSAALSRAASAGPRAPRYVARR